MQSCSHLLEISCCLGGTSGFASEAADCTMAPKGQENARAAQKKKRVFPRVSPKKARVSAYARSFIPNMMQLDWIKRHSYHRLLCQRKPWLGEEINLCMTSDELLTGKANASKPLVQVIPLRNKNMRTCRKKDA